MANSFFTNTLLVRKWSSVLCHHWKSHKTWERQVVLIDIAEKNSLLRLKDRGWMLYVESVYDVWFILHVIYCRCRRIWFFPNRGSDRSSNARDFAMKAGVLFSSEPIGVGKTASPRCSSVRNWLQVTGNNTEGITRHLTAVRVMYWGGGPWFSMLGHASLHFNASLNVCIISRCERCKWQCLDSRTVPEDCTLFRGSFDSFMFCYSPWKE